MLHERAAHLEAGEQGLWEGVECAPLHLSLVKVEFASEQLHAQQGEDDEEEEAFMEFSREFTRSDRAAQCLATQDNGYYNRVREHLVTY